MNSIRSVCTTVHGESLLKPSVEFKVFQLKLFFFSSLYLQVRRSRRPTPALHASSPTAVLGSCCSTHKIPTGSASTWKVNMAALLPHAWVDHPPWAEVQTAPLNLHFMVYTCLQMPAPSTSSASLAQVQVDGTALELWVELGQFPQLLRSIISVFPLRRLSSARRPETTWNHIT